MYRIEQAQLSAGTSLLFMRQTDIVGNSFTALLADDAQHILFPRRGYLFGIAGNFDRRLHDSVPFAFHKLVYPAQSRLIRRCDQLSPYAPDIDSGSLSLKVEDRVLVQIIRGHNLHIGQTRLIKHFSGLDGQIGEVATV
ncbi:hypothetical protein D3C81_1727280 [compost metagenome]